MGTVATLCYIIKDGKVLLIRKKRGIGQGKLNGPGGRVEPEESIKDCAVREMKEETGLDVTDPKIVGELDFYFGKDHFMKVHVLKTGDFRGKETETEEALPVWFDVRQIPFEEMWADDEFWMPLMLEGKSFRGTFNFDENGRNLLNHDLIEI